MSGLFAIARLAGRTVAIAAEQVGSVVDLPAIVRVPLAPAGVRGIAALRSRVVTVLDPAVLLGGTVSTDARRAIVSRIAGHDYAILVDAVEDVATFASCPLTNGLALAGSWTALAVGMIDRPGEPVLAVDLGGLVRSQDALAA